MPEAPTIYALMGPTASGKTEAALAVAEAADVALVSVDSAMVYRGMDVGTAKPQAEVLERHPHALVDIVDPTDAYSAARFVADADKAVRAALAAGRVPLLVGGTMLYFRAFKQGLSDLPSADAALRRAMEERAGRIGWPALHAELAARDPAAAARIDPRNGARIQRGLEVLALTGRPISQWWQSPAATVSARLGCRLEEVALMPPDRAALHARIAARLDAMLRQGFVDEVRRLRETLGTAAPGVPSGLPAMRAVGYAQVWRRLDGEYGHDEMVERALAATRQLARRQLTWLRRWPDARRVETASEATRLLLRGMRG